VSREPVQVDADAFGPYSPGIVAEGRFVYVSGQGAMRDGEYVAGRAGEETRLILENVFRILSAAGCSPGHVVRCGVYLTDMADYDEMNAVWEDWLPPGAAPSRACVQVAALAHPGWRIEIAVVASAVRS